MSASDNKTLMQEIFEGLANRDGTLFTERMSARLSLDQRRRQQTVGHVRRQGRRAARFAGTLAGAAGRTIADIGA